MNHYSNWKNALITKIQIKCGKGFYVRSFARDLAEKLDSKGHVHSLKRTKVGKFNINNANLLDDLLKIGQRLHEFRGFHSSISMLDDILAYEIDDEKTKFDISQGKEVNIGGYYEPTDNLADDVMRPSETLNTILV